MAELFGSDVILLGAALAGLALTTMGILRDLSDAMGARSSSSDLLGGRANAI